MTELTSNPATPGRAHRVHSMLMCLALLGLGAWIVLKPILPAPARALGIPAVPQPHAADQGELPLPPKSFFTLKEAMRDGVSVAFGEISVYSRMGGEGDPEAGAAALKSAESLVEAVAEVPLLAKRNFTAADREFFFKHAAELKRQTARLSAALRAHDQKTSELVLDEIDNTCQACHTRLAPHLIQKK